MLDVDAVFIGHNVLSGMPGNQPPGPFEVVSPLGEFVADDAAGAAGVQEIVGQAEEVVELIERLGREEEEDEEEEIEADVEAKEAEEEIPIVPILAATALLVVGGTAAALTVGAIAFAASKTK